MNAKGQNGYEKFYRQENAGFCGDLRMKKPIIQDQTTRYSKVFFQESICNLALRG